MMKKYFNFRLLTVMTAVLLSSLAMRADVDQVAIWVGTFPDENFRNYMMSLYPRGVLTDRDIDELETLNVAGKSIKSLQGIEYLTHLITLNCSGNQLSTLDLSANTMLAILNCSNNQLKSLGFPNNGELEELNCSRNQLTSLDLSGNMALTTLNCSRNQLPSVDLTANTMLTSLNCSNNQLTALDLSENTLLEELTCSRNLFKSLSLPWELRLFKLQFLDCSQNPLLTTAKISVWDLRYLDISNCPALQSLDCSFNHLTMLDIWGCTALTTLDCSSNNLETLDLTDCTALQSLDCSWNSYLETLDVSGCTALKTLDCSKSDLTSLDVSGCTALKTLDCGSNNLATFNLMGCKALQSLDCSENGLTTLDVSGCTALKTLVCEYNALDEIDVSSCRETLQYLSFMGNNIASFDARNFPSLETLITALNPLTSLNVSGCNKLSVLFVMLSQINQQKMGVLVNSLPVCTAPGGGLFVVLADLGEDYPEGNVITNAQIATAAGKKWLPMKYMIQGDEGVFVPLNGSLKLGDVNYDGIIDVADVVVLISHVLSGRANDYYSYWVLSSVADMNQDLVLDVADVVQLIYYVLNGHLPGEETMDTFTVGGVSFKMVKVEGGTFTMGATPEQTPYAQSNEYPTHEVTLSSYSIGETEVTQALWQAVMGTNPSNWKGDLTHPVEMVSWHDCQTFITKLNEMTGKQFRLPTEAEWEYAARGGNKSQGYIYSGSDNRDEVGWLTGNSAEGTHPVANKQPNELGIYDMSGNVFEWIQDYYGSYSSEPQTNPTGPATGFYRIVRGGSFLHYPTSGRVSCRYSDDVTSRWNDQGLRLAL